VRWLPGLVLAIFEEINSAGWAAGAVRQGI
jgi:hypothetical protein